MINLHASTRVFLCTQAIDMRLGHDGLAGMVKSHFRMNPTCGHLFVFLSRRRDRMKLLLWIPEGFWLFYLRLERSTFAWLDELDLEEGGEIDASDFALILAAINPMPIPVKEKSKKHVVPPRTTPLQLV